MVSQIGGKLLLNKQRAHHKEYRRDNVETGISLVKLDIELPESP